MKHLLFLLLTPFALTSFAQAPQTTAASVGTFVSYGDSITAEGAISVAEFEKAAANVDSMSTKIHTEIQKSCGKKGCWMDVKMADGSAMKVRFRDYGFFVPTSGLEGKEVIMQGRAKKDVTDVAMLQHYAEDAGKSKEEIAAIAEPETSWTFEADGVLIKE
ncbi:MAG: DUF4920 domain-containing protein [Flavobacteriales bacterium]